VADGLSEMVIVQTTEIVAVPGAELAGPLPKEIQGAIAYAAVVVKSSGAPDLADRFVRFLASPPGRAAFEAAGFGLPAAR
jgi:molybdate transport system substrate-binding protein